MTPVTTKSGVRYAELHCLSNFSFLRGASHPAELVTKAAELGYAGLALTDECSVAGIVRAHTAAKNNAFKLIVGSEFIFGDLKAVVLAVDREAYAALCRLITMGRRAALKGTYDLAREDFAHCLQDSGCLVLWVPAEIEEGATRATGAWLKERFGERLWIAAELLNDGDDRRRLARLRSLGARLGTRLVASGNVHMHCRERRMLRDTLAAIRLKTPIEKLGFELQPNAERVLRPLPELERRYPRELLDETVAILERSSFSLDELRYEYPHELVPEGETSAQYLRTLTEQGARWRWPGGLPQKARELIEHELELIAALRYESYFLTVHDIVRYARSQGILCQGRGSAANSVVCFCLGITEVDPARMQMLVERFISKERNEPPDIDVDFEHERREEVIQYIYRKYSRERAAIAATVITYRPRSAIRDVGKALGLDELQVDALAKSMQWWDGGIDEQRIAEAGFDAANPKIRLWLSLAEELLGFPRHLSQHVGGFVIAERPLHELVPVENASMPDRTVIQWDKDDLEELGLLKVDVLGLGMLSAIRRSFELIERFDGRRYTMATVPAEDGHVYEMIGRADTMGVFQIESRAQMAMLPRLKPKNYYDLVIEVAIIRPGPIQGDMVHPYLRRRNKEEPVTYPSDDVRKVLERTLGVPIFQEQVMQLAIVAAGFTPGEADQLRRAMAAWRRSGELEKFEQRLIRGMTDRGYAHEFAVRLFDQIKGFGEYGFPECVVGETRVVDADSGRWITIDEVFSGRARLESTLACDEQLRLRRRKVLAVRRSGVKPVWRLRTALGHSITATAQHPFKTMQGWRQLQELEVGDYVAAARSVPIDGKRHWPRCEIELSALASSDIYWDRIVSIEPLGEAPVYDLEIDGDHNFLANNLVVHNSHAASFALLVYVSAWLKHYEPAVFCCALLNSQPMGFYAPQQLVRSALEHGVEVRPVDANVSHWESTLERDADGRPALRLGLQRVKGLSAEGGERLVAARAEGAFVDVADLAARADLGGKDLGALASAGALQSFAGHRHRARWQVAGVEKPTALFDSLRFAEALPMLRRPTEAQDIAADYGHLGVSLGRHPLALLRARLTAMRVLDARSVAAAEPGTRVYAAGLVITRQRPSSASGVTFVTLEDETGYLNLVVWESLAQSARRALLGSALLGVVGKVQKEGGVLHVIAERLYDHSELLGKLVTHSRDFH